MRYHEIVEKIMPPQGIPSTYYHGTSKEERAMSILQNGIAPQCPIQMGRKKNAKMTPVADMIYLTPSIQYAQIYAMGGNMAGHEYPEKRMQGSRYGYLFSLDSSMFNEIQPDEDVVGRAVRMAIGFVRKGEGNAVSEYTDDPAFDQSFLDAGMDFWKSLNAFASSALTPLQFRNLKSGNDTADEASLGKKLLKTMTPAMKARFILMGAHIAHHGTLKPNACWKIDKALSKELKRDGSNFFEIAEKIA